MIEKELCSLIMEKYYPDVYRFCLSVLKDENAAHDCTQETFLVFFRKRHKLDVTDKMLGWLFNTAGNVIKDYRKRNSVNYIPLDAIADIIPDKAVHTEDPMEIIRRCLDSEDAELFIEYLDCTGTDDKKALAQKYGVSVGYLYTKISRLKAEIVRYINSEI